MGQHAGGNRWPAWIKVCAVVGALLITFAIVGSLLPKPSHDSVASFTGRQSSILATRTVLGSVHRFDARGLDMGTMKVQREDSNDHVDITIGGAPNGGVLHLSFTNVQWAELMRS